MVSNSSWVRQVRTPAKSIYRASDYEQRGSKVVVTYNIEKRTEYLLRARLTHFERVNGVPMATRKVNALRKQIRASLETILEDTND